MFGDDDRPRPKAAITAGEDLSSHSVGELEARIAGLEAEIVRTRAQLEAKRGSRSAADRAFRL